MYSHWVVFKVFVRAYSRVEIDSVILQILGGVITLTCRNKVIIGPTSKQVLHTLPMAGRNAFESKNVFRRKVGQYVIRGTVTNHGVENDESLEDDLRNAPVNEPEIVELILQRTMEFGSLSRGASALHTS